MRTLTGFPTSAAVKFFQRISSLNGHEEHNKNIQPPRENQDFFEEKYKIGERI
jgi:hypothetical protein